MNEQSEKITLVSSQFPSGVAWLLNFFLANDLLIYRGLNPEVTWDIENGNYVLKPEQEVLKQWLPLILEKSSFQFKTKPAIRWLHDFPNFQNSREKTILLVRDGRDAIYSFYKRLTGNQSFVYFLNSPVDPYDFPPAITWAMFNRLWSEIIDPAKLFIIHFEQLKTNPYPTLKKMLEFIGLDLTDKQVFYGIDASSFDKAKKAEATYRAQSQKTEFDLVNRKGQPGEWKEVYGEKELAHFEGLPNEILNKFGYKITPELPINEPEDVQSDENLNVLINDLTQKFYHNYDYQYDETDRIFKIYQNLLRPIAQKNYVKNALGKLFADNFHIAKAARILSGSGQNNFIRILFRVYFTKIKKLLKKLIKP